MTSEMILLIGTLGSGLIGASAALLGNWLNKRSEERKHYRQLVINALENRKHVSQSLMAHNVRGSYVPLDDYILHMIKFTELMIDQKTDESNVDQKLKDLRAFTDKVLAYRRKEIEEDRS